MAKRRVVRRKLDVKPEVDVDEDELDLIDDIDLDDDDEDEEVPVRKSRSVAKKVVMDDDEDDDDEDDDDEDDDDEEDELEIAIQKNAKKNRKSPKAKPAAKVVSDDDEDDAEEVVESKIRVKSGMELEAEVISNFILNTLEEGQGITFVRKNASTLEMFKFDPAMVAGNVQKMSRKEFKDAVHSDEYKEWREAWRNFSAEEKLAYAKKNKIKWEEHENPQVNLMRLTAAVREAEGISKYRPEFESRASRSGLR